MHKPRFRFHDAVLIYDHCSIGCKYLKNRYSVRFTSMNTPRVLVIENEEAARTLVERRFDNELYIQSAANLQAAIDDHIRRPFDIVVWDTISVPPQCVSIVRVFKKFLRSHLDTRLIVISDVKEPEIINLHNLRCEWLQQPLDESEFLALVEAAAMCKAANNGSPAGEMEFPVPTEFEGIVAVTLRMRSVIQHIMEAAAEDIPVLITGETGTGKDLVGAAIHKRSKRKTSPYIAV